MSWQDFAAEMAERLSPHEAEDVKLISKGMMLFQQGMVQQLKINENGTVATAVVQDVVPVKVELDLDFPGMSTCSCPNEEPCRHMLAVFFTGYSKEASVAEWIAQWREPAREVSAQAQLGIQRAKDLVKANSVLHPDYERWVQSMEESFDTILKSKMHSNPYVVVELFGVYMRRVKAGRPIEAEWQIPYDLISNVVSFKKLAVLAEEFGHKEEVVKRAYLHLFHELVDDAEEAMIRISQRTLPFDFEQFIEKFVEDSIGILDCVQGLEYERIWLYRSLWTYFFKKKEWREQEIERIRVRLKELPDWGNPMPLLVAEIHHSLILGDQVEAVRLMDRIREEYLVPYMLYWIDYFTRQKAWKLVEPVVDALVRKVRVYLDDIGTYHACSTFTRLAMKSISPYCVENGRVDLYEKALLQTLPYSFYDYEHLLYNRGQYDRWGELFSFVGIPFSDMPKDRVKVIEKEHPEVLLGILHQTVQHEIDLKNRSSYRAAVRHLKKLRTLYKKMKRQSDWQFFLTTLLEKTKRLRAFHEECRRSKLIDA